MDPSDDLPGWHTIDSDSAGLGCGKGHPARWVELGISLVLCMRVHLCSADIVLLSRVLVSRSART